MKDNFETPVALALVACDTIITDAQTGKKTLVGLFNSVGASNFPHVIPQFFVFASMTNAEGETEIRVRLQAGNGDAVCDMPGKVNIPTPLDAPEFIFNVQNLQIPAPGTYELQLVANDIPVASRLLTFRQLQPPPAEGPRA